jgi:hypothetical protein
MNKIQRYLLIWAIFNLVILFTGCATTWIGQADNIIAALIPAINAALAILAAFGIGVSPAALAAVEAWGTQAQDALNNVVKPALDAYNNAAADVKATLLNNIKAALDSIIANMQTALADVHVTNPATQAKITAIFAVVEAFMVSLANLLPVLQGKVTDPHEAHALVRAVMPAKEFKAEFNALAGEFGPQYKIQ